MFSIV